MGNRNYFTNHQGIAAYCILSGIELLGAEPSQNKAGQPCTKFDLDTDPHTGRKLGDQYFDGTAEGNLKAFSEALQTVKRAAWEAKVDTENDQ